MKSIKRLGSLVIAMMLVFTMMIPSYATNLGKITIKNNTESTGISMVGHTYSVYKVFDLTQSGDNYSYNLNEDYKEFFKNNAKTDRVDVSTDVKLNNYAKNLITENNHHLSEKLQNYTIRKGVTARKTSDAEKITVANKVETVVIEGLEKGYYLILDNGKNEEADTQSVIALAAMGTTDIEINLKGSAPTIDKEIKHNEDGNWGVVGDNQIGDKVEYRFISTVPDTTGYDKYTYKIHDKMSDGLTFNNDVVIKINNDDSKVLDSNYYTVITNTEHEDTFDIDVKLLDAVYDNKLSKDDELYIYFTATLNENAVVAGDHNDNKVNLEYSNNPYDEDSKDKTPDVIVKDYTFKLNATKKNDSDEILEGVEFELRKGENPLYFKEEKVTNGSNKYIVCADKHTHGSDCKKTIISGANGDFEIIGLDDNVEYTLVETKPLDGYNPIEPIKFTIKVEYYENGDIKSIETSTDSIAKVGDSFELGTTVVNTSGSKLPETGGMGTTIFTVIGSALMLITGAMLIRRRREN